MSDQKYEPWRLGMMDETRVDHPNCRCAVEPMTETRTVLDAETVAELWPVCEMRFGIYDTQVGAGAPQTIEDCVTPAQWIVHVRCGCGNVEIGLLCTAHLRGLLPAGGTRYWCPGCGWTRPGQATVAFVQELR